MLNPIAPARALLSSSAYRARSSTPRARHRAASGLGLALAEAWAQRGWHVLLTDRDTAAVEREATRLAPRRLVPRAAREVAERLASRAGSGALPEPRIAWLRSM